jgi:hypothetical protein
MTPRCVGGSRSEGQWRKEFAAGGLVDGKRVQGLPVLKPDIKEVEVGILRVYGCHSRDEVFVFDDCEGYLEEKRSYSRVLDATGEPTEAIDAKETFHRLDAERYILGWLRRGALGSEVPKTETEEIEAAAMKAEAERAAAQRHLMNQGWR